MTSRRNFIIASALGLAGATGIARAQTRPGTVTQNMPGIALDQAAEPQPRDGFALALGGGAAKAFAHIPYLQSLDELGIRPKQMTGTSMGSIIGALYAAGMSGSEIREYGVELLTRRQSLLKRLLIDTGETWGSLFNLFRPAVIEPEILFEALMPADLPASFEDLEIPLAIVATDFYAQSEYVMRDGPLLSAIAASSALPVLLTPVRRDGRVLIDGGFVNPTPFDLLDAERYVTIAIDVTGSTIENNDDIPGSFETWAGSFSITEHSIVVEKLKNAPPDLFVAPDVGRYKPLDFFNIEAILSTVDSDQDAFKRQMEQLAEQNN
ncbi:patatin-like phospholipase family protein [Martelella soudanensis]|uniref:patatin-like phospholipase family protein n=1 Tax=unclassified Martelella TaxID=2629616 RepID=UPI0015DD9C7E|nr:MULTISPECIES: patatin-like phospholipase family protein [unclassified Martelella]